MYVLYVRELAIATLVRRVDRPAITVGMDGSLYRFHPEFHRILTKTIDDLLQRKYQVISYSPVSERSHIWTTYRS